MTDAPKPLTEGRRVTYELKAVEGSRLVTLLSFRSLEQVMKAAPTPNRDAA